MTKDCPVYVAVQTLVSLGQGHKMICIQESGTLICFGNLKKLQMLYCHLAS